MTPKCVLNNVLSWYWDLDVLIQKMSFEKAPQEEKGPGIDCFLSPRHVRMRATKKASFSGPLAHARTPGVPIGNILSQEPFLLEDPFQKKFV